MRYCKYIRFLPSEQKRPYKESECHFVIPGPFDGLRANSTVLRGVEESALSTADPSSASPACRQAGGRSGWQCGKV